MILVIMVIACLLAVGNSFASSPPITFRTKGEACTGTSEPGSCDTDSSGNINTLDITTLINYVYKGGSEPHCP